jgi:hypothetical protein
VKLLNHLVIVILTLMIEEFVDPLDEKIAERLRETDE